MRSKRSRGSNVRFVKKSKSSEKRCPSRRARAVPPYSTNCFGVAASSFQRARCGSGSIFSFGEKPINLAGCLSQTRGILHRANNILPVFFPRANFLVSLSLRLFFCRHPSHASMNPCGSVWPASESQVGLLPIASDLRADRGGHYFLLPEYLRRAPPHFSRLAPRMGVVSPALGE